MKPLNILICGGDDPALQRTAQVLTDEGIRVATSTRVIDNLCFSGQQWDFLLIDLDGLSSFLRSLLPAVARRFPELSIVGFSTRKEIDATDLGYGLELDGYVYGVPRAEDLIVRFPHVAAKYLCDTGPLTSASAQPLTTAVSPT